MGGKPSWLVVPALVAAGLLGYRIGGAGDEPTNASVTFSGILDEGGVAVNGTRDVSLQFFADNIGANPLCAASNASVDVVNGFFDLPASPACIAALSKQHEAYYRITVGATALPVTRVPSAAAALRSETDFRGTRLTRKTVRGEDGSLWSDNSMYDTQLATECSYRTVKNGPTIELRCVPAQGPSVGFPGPTFLDPACTQPVPAGATVSTSDPGHLTDVDISDPSIVTAVYQSSPLGSVYVLIGGVTCNPTSYFAFGKGASIPLTSFVLGTGYP